ncbi:MAG: D-alanine--poly(phosphoribitol) ligase subunit DltC [Propionibacteriaceae bacterium]|nr:D-alanine--poly(phosphoribitol) ligase subunit DltC [Propionibacteriaceae bacterium]
MSDEGFEAKVSQLIVDVCGTGEVLEEPDLDLFEAGVLDSMGFVELLYGFEAEFGVQVPPTEIERDEVSSVNKIIGFLKDRL